ncbi:MAG: tetratricopeptide repeat protein [Elusimicrobiota bacterium]|nr:MAG: tetratricopeptide repeat protein [Elusimicrobiota bacterium]
MSAWREFLDAGSAALSARERARLARLFTEDCPFDLAGDELNLHYVMSLCIRVTCHRVIDGRLRLFTKKDEAGMLMKGGHIPLCGHPFTWFAVTAAREGRLGGAWAAADALADMLAARPRSAFLHALRGLALLPVRRYQDAIAEFTRALELGGRDARVLAWRGSAYVQLTDLTRARADLDAAVAGGAGPWALAWRAEVLWLAGRKDAARADLARALELAPGSAALHVLGARRGRESLLDRAEALAPRLLWVHALRGHIRQWSGDLAGAEASFKRMTEIHDHRWSYARLAGARLRRGDEAGAERAWRRGLRDEEDAKWVLGRLPPLVRCTLYSGAGEDCELGVQDVADLGKLLADRPRHGWARAVRASLIGHQLWKGEELRRASRDRRDPRLTALWAQELVYRAPDAALALLDDALRREPRNPWIRSLRARALWAKGKGREALAACARALDVYAMDLDANCLSGIVRLTGAKDARGVRRALAEMGAGLTIYANHPRVLLARREGHARLRRWRSALEDMAAAARDDASLTWADAASGPRDPARALRELERLTAALPEEAEGWAWRAKALLDLGRVAQGEKALVRALRLDPRCAWALTWRGELAFKRGRLAAAERDLDRAIAADPYHGRAYGARAAVRGARGRRAGAASDIGVYLQLIRTDRGASRSARGSGGSRETRARPSGSSPRSSRSTPTRTGASTSARSLASSSATSTAPSRTSPPTARSPSGPSDRARKASGR